MKKYAKVTVILNFIVNAQVMILLETNNYNFIFMYGNLKFKIPVLDFYFKLILLMQTLDTISKLFASNLLAPYTIIYYYCNNVHIIITS